ncbi:hypothetical protein BB561_005559, partial [Smittium simulii]
MSNVPGAIPSAAEYSTVAKTGLIDLVPKNDHYFNFPSKNNQKNEKNTKKNEKFEKFQQNIKNNVKKIIKPALNPQEFTEVSIMHLLNNSIPKVLKKPCYGGSDKKIGYIWTQFLGDIDAAIDQVALKSAEKCMDAPKYYNGHWKSECTEIQKFRQNNSKYQKKVNKNAQKISQNIVGLTPKSAMETTINNLFANINEKINQEAQKKFKEPEEHTIKSMQNKIDNFFLISSKKKNYFRRGTDLKKIYIGSKFNSIKQPEERNLDLLDQPIYAQSSFLEQLELILIKSAPAVLCLQETHLSETSNFFSLKKYTCVESKKNLTKIDSGLLVALKNRSEWSISEIRSEYTWMSCDFNMDPNKTMNWINRMGVGLIRTPIYNSKGSRLKGSKMGRMIDHICSTDLGFQSISAS